MPSFELLIENNEPMTDANVLNAIKHVTATNTNPSFILNNNDNTNSKYNFSGRRINAYIRIIEVVQQLENMRQCATCYRKNNISFSFVTVGTWGKK